MPGFGCPTRNLEEARQALRETPSAFVRAFPNITKVVRVLRSPEAPSLKVDQLHPDVDEWLNNPDAVRAAATILLDKPLMPTPRVTVDKFTHHFRRGDSGAIRPAKSGSVELRCTDCGAWVAFRHSVVPAFGVTTLTTYVGNWSAALCNLMVQANRLLIRRSFVEKGMDMSLQEAPWWQPFCRVHTNMFPFHPALNAFRMSCADGGIRGAIMNNKRDLDGGIALKPILRMQGPRRSRAALRARRYLRQRVRTQEMRRAPLQGRKSKMLFAW